MDKITVSEMARLCGVSVRTLQYYDDIGLLHPCETSDAGYRYYDGQNLEMMQQVLFLRELGFPLRDIATMLRDPNYDRRAALARQKELLLLQKARLERLIALAERTMKGEPIMSLDDFSMKEIEEHRDKYAAEAEQRWGDTDAYKQSAARTAKYGKADWARIQEESGAVFGGFAACAAAGTPADSPDAQALVQQWRDHLNRNFYDCSIELLAGLGTMYIADERFTKNLDRFGAGTAQMMADAIAVYCERNK